MSIDRRPLSLASGHSCCSGNKQQKPNFTFRPRHCNPCICYKERPAGRQLCQELSEQSPDTCRVLRGPPRGEWRIIHWLTRCCCKNQMVKDQTYPRIYSSRKNSVCKSACVSEFFLLADNKMCWVSSERPCLPGALMAAGICPTAPWCSSTSQQAQWHPGYQHSSLALPRYGTDCQIGQEMALHKSKDSL